MKRLRLDVNTGGFYKTNWDRKFYIIVSYPRGAVLGASELDCTLLCQSFAVVYLCRLGYDRIFLPLHAAFFTGL